MENWRSSQDVNYSLISAVCKGNLERAKELIGSFGLSYSQGYSLLRDALRNKHTAIAKLLLTNGSEVNPNPRGCVNTPPHFAVMNCDIEIVMMILDKGANVNAQNDYGMTPLHVAVEIGCLQIVKHLLHSGANVNAMCILRRSYTSLHFAVERGSTEVVTLLLSRGANVDAKGEDYITPLHIVAQNGYIDIAEILLNHGACIHSSTLKEGYMPQHSASERDNEEVVKLFLTRGADIEARTKDNSTSLHVATGGKCEKVVKLLLQHGAKVDNQDKNGKTILHFAVEIGNLTIVEDILKYCPDINDQSNRNSLKIAVLRYGERYKNIVESLSEYGFVIDPEDANDPELLHAAVEKGYLKVVEDLLKYGADVNTLHNSSYREGFTLLHSAAKNKQEEVAKLLISYKADVNAQDKTGKTPIFYAIENADSKITKLLLTNRADIKGDPELLNIAVKKTCIEIVEALLQNGADINASDEFGRTALHFIVLSENEGFRGLCVNEDLAINIKGEIAKLLLSKGANVDAQTINGTTTLHAAVQKGYAKVVEALLEYNANIDSVVNIEQKDGITPLHLAIQEGHEEVVKLLLERGAKVGSKIKNDMTLLHLAAKKRSSKMIEILLKFGIDIDSRDEKGRTALHIASEKGHGKIVKTLLEYGSDINITTVDNHTAFGYALLGSRATYNSRRHAGKYDLTVQALQCHIIKMRILNLYVNPADLRETRFICEPGDFRLECMKEIARMKIEKINNLKISFYDILTNDTSLLGMYMRNENVVEILESNDYKTKFPIYASIIRSNFKKGMVRRELLEQGNEIFHLLFNNLPELPYYCAEKIISYLSDDDLRIFINACQSPGIGNFNTNSNDKASTSSISEVQYVQAVKE